MSDQYVSDSAAAGGSLAESQDDSPRKSGGGLWRWLAYVMIAVVAAGVAFLLTRGSSDPKVGDCLPASAVSVQGSGNADTLNAIDCSDSQAAFKVVGIVTGKRSDEANLQDCTTQWPTTVEGMWFGPEGKLGSVLCLASVTH